MPYIENRDAWFQGQGLWPDTPASDWRDWTWQLKLILLRYKVCLSKKCLIKN